MLLVGLACIVAAAACDTAPPAQTPPAPTAAAIPAPATGGPVTPPKTDEDKIKSAMSAAPDPIAKDASVMDMDEKGQMKMLRQGTNGWTCMPDQAATPGPDPMCVDANGTEWAMAWAAHKDPPKNKTGFGYMLAGGSDASNTDPFAEKPKDGEKWVTTGPHVMVLNIGDRFTGYPTTADDTTKPYVMYAGTPYAHLMIPVK
jgi:hypothetical protein